MISNSRVHQEKMKLSDRFKQPFETSISEVVSRFNRYGLKNKHKSMMRKEGKTNPVARIKK